MRHYDGVCFYLQMARIKKQSQRGREIIDVASVYGWNPATEGVKTRSLRPGRRELRSVVAQETWNVWAHIAIDEWRVAYRVGIHRGRAVITELRVFPLESGQPRGTWSAEALGVFAPAPKGGIPASLLRQIPLGR